MTTTRYMNLNAELLAVLRRMARHGDAMPLTAAEILDQGKAWRQFSNVPSVGTVRTRLRRLDDAGRVRVTSLDGRGAAYYVIAEEKA